MKTKTFYSLYPLVLLLLSVGTVWAQRGPQDSWYLDREIDLPQMPGMNSPRGIHISANGDIYVCDVGDNDDRISVWRADGSFKTAFSSYGGKDENIRDPHGIAVGQNVIVVTDSYNHRIKIFDLKGKFIRKWGNHGNGDGQMKQPRDVFIDSNGLTGPELYVCDKENHRIQVFDLNGTFIRKFGTHGNGDGQLDNPQGVEIGPDGLVYVSSTNDRRVLVFQKDGTYIRRFGTTRAPYHLSFIGSRIAVTTDYHSVRIFETNGTMVSMIGTESAGSSEGEFNLSYGISIDSTGSLHVADANNHRIQVFDTNGTHQRTYGLKGKGGMGSHGIAVTPENTFLISDAHGDRIFETDSNGSLLRLFGNEGTEDGEFDYPRKLSLGPSGKIYVSDTNNHRIQVFDRNGTFVQKFGTIGSANGQFNAPMGIAVSSEQEIFVVDRNNDRIQVFDSNGTFLRKWGTRGNLDGQLNDPLDLIFDGMGNVLVSDYENNRIVVFNKSGQFLRKWNINSKAWQLSSLVGGLIAVIAENNDYPHIYVFETDGTLVKSWRGQNKGWNSPVVGMNDGTIVLANQLRTNGGVDKLEFYRQTFRTIRSNSSSEIPLPEVISVAQRSGTNYLDVTYRVNDVDSSTVQTALLGFVDGGNDLSKVIVPKTFVGNTVGKLGQNVPTGQSHTVTWNAGADWNVGFGELEMAVLAKDNRDLLNLHFLTLPPTESNSTELKINRSPITNNDLLNVWYWLLATGDTGIKLTGSLIHQPETPLASDFSPLSLPGIQLWLDANDIDGDSLGDTLEDNISLSLWVDKAGGDHNATQTNESKKPSYALNSLNGKATVFFDNDGGMTTTLNLTRPYTVVAVFNSIDTGSGHRRAIQGSRNWLIGPYNGKIGFYAGNWVSNSLTRQTGIFYLTMAINDGTMSSFIVDGIDRTTSSSPIGNPNTIHLGASGGHSGEILNGYIAEVFAFDQALAESDRINLGKYLAGKWNLPYSTKIYALGSQTKELGRTYLLNKMNLREATTEEIARAKEGATEGLINAFTPTFQVGPNERPDKVNEYGFDTGSTTGFWVVPTQ